MNKYMNMALKEAEKAINNDDVPVGAVIVENGKVIAKAYNTREKQNNVIRHAEINALEKACKKKNNWYLNDCEIYVTLEPCKMCVGAIEQARIKKIYYAAKSEKPLPHKPIFKKIDDNDQSQNMLKTFFENKRK